MNNEKIPLSEAATRLGSTPLNVLMHIKRELLAAEEIDGSWFVDSASLEEFLARREEAPQESVCKSSCAHKCSSCG